MERIVSECVTETIARCGGINFLASKMNLGRFERARGGFIVRNRGYNVVAYKQRKRAELMAEMINSGVKKLTAAPGGGADPDMGDCLGAPAASDTESDEGVEVIPPVTARLIESMVGASKLPPSLAAGKENEIAAKMEGAHIIVQEPDEKPKRGKKDKPKRAKSPPKSESSSSEEKPKRGKGLKGEAQLPHSKKVRAPRTKRAPAEPLKRANIADDRVRKYMERFGAVSKLEIFECAPDSPKRYMAVFVLDRGEDLSAVVRRVRFGKRGDLGVSDGVFIDGRELTLKRAKGRNPRAPPPYMSAGTPTSLEFWLMYAPGI
jgi:hypothetical protein